ncbi:MULTISPECIES: preprotein translocase subunit YajC [unclassified Dehalobacter]|uniref:preprotein translocase subunit YajC n=1 Tax=unclassified Dehalobacter TaxID=2635733 RepID=UPI000E6B97FF|nr:MULTISPECIES: preprotein translocase subunit YajC [unclassified Dehalobacter]RJE46763.1 preprotein translocase subunit YajC [Dehalobacter sp. MCB1]TCX49276.1 preprotein translocase subunit YajC [Dehalobacter sp. 14DCB1]TCX49856.1 preprotein translocase subunit YajC [Dehalobacter sp. 12DCB1]
MDQSTTTMMYFAVFVIMIIFMFVLPSRKQKQERQRLMESIKIKAKVITIGGILGTITKIKEDTVVIKIASNVEIEILKSAIKSAEGGKETPVKTHKKNKPEPEEEAEETEEIDEDNDTKVKDDK